MFRVFSVKNLLLGFLSWLIPLAVSFAFFGKDGLWIPQPLFKSLMVVIGGGSGLWLLLRAFRNEPLTASYGAAVGLLWLAINLGLDAALLVPLTGMTLPGWFQDIGLRYLVIPMMGWALGVQAERARSS
jgi:hypothetical protein